MEVPMQVPFGIGPDAKEVQLTSVGGTRINAVLTESPWKMDFDAIVVPYGSGRDPGLGGNFALALYQALGAAADELEMKFKDMMSRLPGRILRPDNPQLIRLSGREVPDSVRTHTFIFATAFNHDEEPSVQRAGIAASAIVKLAEAERLKRVAIVPLGSGAGGLPESRVYEEMIEGAVQALPVKGVEEVVFTAMKRSRIVKLQRLFSKRAQPLRNDLAEGEDLLGVASEISCLAEALLMRDLRAPITVGILGGWGSGKTFAMHLMQEEMKRIRTLSVAEKETWPSPSTSNSFPYVGHVYMIHFDAWTYAKSDLWSSLMQTILRGLNHQLFLENKLDEFLKDNDKRDNKPLLEAGVIWRYIFGLPEEQQQFFLNEYLGEATLRELREALREAKPKEVESLLWDRLKKLSGSEEETLGELEKEVEEKKRELTQASREYENELETQAAEQAREAVLKGSMQELSDEVIERIDVYLRAMGGLSVGDIQRLFAVGPTLKDLWRLFREQWVIYLALLAFTAAPILLPVFFNELDRLQIPAFMVSLYSLLITFIKAGAHWNRVLSAKIAQYQDQIEEKRAQLSLEPVEELAQKAKDLEEAQQVYEESKEQLAVQKQKMGLAFQYRSLNDFIQARLEEGVYEKGLGPMHQIQSDIEEITSNFTIYEHDLQEGQKKELFPRGPARIVLFIDDLDRCPPDKVVEMLEAIQILVKTSLFVVVMAVDVRFITKALEKEYKDILVRKGDPSGLDYIEKIIQIPYRVRSIAPDAVGTYLESQMELVADEPQATRQSTPPDQEEVQPSDPDSQLLRSSDRGREKGVTQLPRDVIKFTQEEFEIIESCCKQIGLTPRSVKRLVNIYKILKIIWERANRYQSPNKEVKQTVVALLALSARYPDLMRDVLDELGGLMNQPERERGDRLLLDCLPEEGSQCDTYMEREYRQLCLKARSLISSNLEVDTLSGGTLDLIRSFSFVGDIGYSPIDELNGSLSHIDTNQFSS